MFRLHETFRGRRPLGALLGALLILGPSQAQDAAVEPLRVVATVGMIGDLAERIAGPCGDVTTLMGPGVDPHLYQATSGDVRALGRAELILYAGLSLEGQLGDVLDRFGARVPTVAVSEAAVPEARRIAAGEGYAFDPHVWMDVGLWADAVPVLRDAMAELRPACADALARRADALAADMRAMDGWIADAVATIPAPQRVLVTAHDAFAYYGRAYDLALQGVQGISTESEASIADIRTTARRIADQGVPTLFVESTINPRTVRAVLEAAQDLGADVRLGGTLYGDALGEAGTLEGSYLGMAYVTTRRIVEGLGGDPPPLPDALDDWRDRRGVAGGDALDAAFEAAS
ncbi:MAG: zinc ABC transporter substrate-binding protein [Trueperaceae bacterium]|nr:zinc ABC transporter substrate-binding protein [Trueperaceae bacterium]